MIDGQELIEDRGGTNHTGPGLHKGVAMQLQVTALQNHLLCGGVKGSV